jgi:hypothetical protein
LSPARSSSRRRTPPPYTNWGKLRRTLPPLSAYKTWAFVLVPLVGLVELTAHEKQTHGAVPDRDWAEAREMVKGIAKPDDLVVFAPRWVDPIGREIFGPAIATLGREARPDETRFPRAIEVSIRGGRTPALDGWREVVEQRAGAVTVRTLENPAPVTLVDDLLRHDDPGGMQVFRVDAGREQECPFSHGGVQSGGLGFGPAVPGDKFACPGGSFVGVSVMPDLDYWPRRCFYAPPSGGSATLRIRFTGVAFGRALHGHHGLYVEAERNKDGAPVTLVFHVGDTEIGRAVHNDGEGWKPFEFSTEPYAGQKADLVADISSPNGHRRMYCFEADTR